VHELAIARSIHAIATRHAAGRPVATVRVRVGHLRQVVAPALEHAFAICCATGGLEGAALEIEEVAPAGVCERCGSEGSWSSFPFACPACGSLEVELRRGEELIVSEIELSGTEAGAKAGERDGAEAGPAA
jgi:hydrogenase nickel incorporation protein HypA/HybF